MGVVEAPSAIRFLISPEIGIPAAGGALPEPLACSGSLFSVVMAIPSMLFYSYLSLVLYWKSYAKINYGRRSPITVVYFRLLWLFSLYNFVWCNNRLILRHAFVFSGIIAAVDILIKAITVFGFGVPLFIDNPETTNPVKWVFWIIYKLLLTAVYGFVLFIHCTKWRERLPARPAFYNYILAMFLFYAITVALLARVLLENRAEFGFWLYDLTTICYHSFYPPLVYSAFLADYFQGEDLRLENGQYEENVAGFFDADWD